MRVAFFGQSGPYAPEALRALLSKAVPFTVAWVVEGRKVPVGRQPHRFIEPSPRPLPGGESLGDVASAAGARVLQSCDVNADFAIKRLEQERLDALVCVGFDRLFSPDLLRVFPVAINAHPSALPKLRGPSPLFWSLRNGDSQTAVTLHAIDAGEDRGAILAQQALPIPPRVTGEALYNSAGRLAGQMLRNVLSQQALGHLVGVPQDSSQATRAPRPQAEDVHVVPENWNCQHLLNFANGAPYFRTPWLRLGGDTFHVRSGIQCEPGKRLPAQYVIIDDTLVVQCRDGLVHLQIQT